METEILNRNRGETINLDINFLNKIENLRNSLIDNELTIDDITAEVEAVRKERYETGRQIIG